MIIKRKSVFSGVTRSKDIPVDPEHFAEYEAGYGSLQDLMPYLTDEDREFILSGMTPDEWKNAFSQEILDIVSDNF